MSRNLIIFMLRLFLGLRGDCPWIKQPLFLIYRFAVSFPQKTFAAIV